MREEYIAGLDPYLDCVPTGLSSRFRLDLMSPSDALDAIDIPPRKFGVTFDRYAVEHLVVDLADNPEESRYLAPIKDLPLIEPLHLQVVCRRIWEKRNKDRNTISINDIESHGGTDIALADYYAERVTAISRLDNKNDKTSRERNLQLESKIRNWFNDHLINVQDSKYSRNLIDEEDTSVQELKNYFNRDIIHELSEAYLIRKEIRPRQSWYELAHDRLVEPIIENNKKWFDKNLQPVQKRAREWEKTQRPDGLLFKGKALRKALKWLSDQPKYEVELERKFITESKRKRLYSRILHIMGAAIVSLCIYAVWQWHEIKENINALQNKHDALEESNRLNRVLALTSFAQRQRWIQSEPELAALLARQSFLYQDKLSSPSSTQSHVDRALRMTFSVHPFSVSIPLIPADNPELEEHGNLSSTQLMAVHPSLPKLAVLHGSQTIIVRDYGPTDKTSQRIELDGIKPISMAFQPNSNHLLGVMPNELIIFDITTGEIVNRIDNKTESQIVLFSPNGNHLITGGINKQLKLWNTGDWTYKSLAYSNATDQKSSLSEDLVAIFSADSKLIAVGNSQGRIVVWRITDLSTPFWTKHSTFDPCDDCSKKPALAALAFAPDGRWLITIPSRDDDIRFWSLSKNQDHYISLIKDIGSQARDEWLIKQGMFVNRISQEVRILSATLFPTPPKLVTGDENGDIRVWDLQRIWEQLNENTHSITRPYDNWVTPLGPINNLVFLDSSNKTNNSQVLSVADSLGRLRAFYPERFQHHTYLPLNSDSGYIRAVRFGKSGNLYSARLNDGLYKQNSYQAHSPPKQLVKLKGIRDFDFSPDEKIFVLGRQNHEVALLDISSSKPKVVNLGTHDDGLWAVAYSPNGDLVATGSWDGTVKFWRIIRKNDQLQARQLPDRELRYENQHILSLAFDPTGQWIAIGISNGVIDVRSLANGDSYTINHAHAGFIWDLDFSPDGNQLASASDDGTIQLWSIPDFASITRLEGHSGGVKAIDFSPNGQLLASGGSDGEIRLWQVNELEFEPTILRINRPHGEILTVAFGPKGEQLAFGDTQGHIDLQSINTKMLAEQVCSMVWRNLSKVEWDRYIPNTEYECTCPNLEPGVGIDDCPQR
jgi:WD40 repeat protein